MKKQWNRVNPLVVIVLIVLLFIMVFSTVKMVEVAFVDSHTEAENVAQSKTIVRNEVHYYPRQDITTFLVMGIDETGKVKPSNSYNNTGEADMVALVVFDDADKTYSTLILNRDTMVEMPVIGVGGKSAGSIIAQLALSHTFGRGLEDSCENTVSTVSDFLYGLNIDYYLSMNIDAISILTDSVGGVEVTVTDDFSKVDESIPLGKTVLNGEQAISFIQTRKNLSDQMNISRIERHKSFMKGFADALNKTYKEQGAGFITKAYNDIEKYTVSDCSLKSMNSLMERCANYKFKEVVSPKGKNVKADDYMEFYVNEKAMDKLILRLFYAEK